MDHRLSSSSNKRPIHTNKTHTTFCRKHPNRNQTPGVCALCLSQRLQKLASSSGPLCFYLSSTTSSSSSSSSDLSYLSYTPSSCASPIVEWEPRQKPVREWLTKCRSTAPGFLQRKKGKIEMEGGGEMMSKRGFWSKLVPRKNKGLMASTGLGEGTVVA